MLLRRLSEAVRKQNWFTVLIELLVVVIGVVLALLLGQWKQEHGLVRDAELRAGLVQFREQVRIAKEALNHVRSELSDYVPVVHLKLLFEPDSVGLFSSRIADYDFDALAAGPEVVNAVGLSRRMLVAVASNHANPLATARRLQRHMERAP